MSLGLTYQAIALTNTLLGNAAEIGGISSSPVYKNRIWRQVPGAKDLIPPGSGHPEKDAGGILVTLGAKQCKTASRIYWYWIRPLAEKHRSVDFH